MQVRPRALNLFLFALLILFLAHPSDADAAAELTAKSYRKHSQNMGVVLVAVSWGRQEACGDYESAQLERLEFNRWPDANEGNKTDSAARLKLTSPMRVMVDPVFTNYGFMLKPGEYALTEFSVKVAKTGSDVRYVLADKQDLIENGAPTAGTFTINPGEVVYIGNFFVDCAGEHPVPWRYFTENGLGWTSHQIEFKHKFEFLANAPIVYRLFKTQRFGTDPEAKRS
jgi:hypothetical protein